MPSRQVFTFKQKGKSYNYNISYNFLRWDGPPEGYIGANVLLTRNESLFLLKFRKDKRFTCVTRKEFQLSTNKFKKYISDDFYRFCKILILFKCTRTFNGTYFFPLFKKLQMTSSIVYDNFT